MAEPQSELVKLAEAVVADLNAGAFSQEFSAVRCWVPEWTLVELATLRVSVAVQNVTRSILTRGKTRREYRVEIAVQKKVGTDPEVPAQTETDALMRLAEEIASHFDFRRLTDVPEAMWAGTEHATAYDETHLQDKRVFSSLVAVTYQIAG